MIHKKLTTALLSTAACMALPVMYPDSVPVDPADPRIGQHVYAVPMSNWTVWGNDNVPPGGDFDFNDAVMSIMFAPDGSGWATWLGANSAWTNDWTVEGQTVGPTAFAWWFPAITGEKVDIVLVTQYGAVYATGSRNVLVDQQTPEPVAWVLIGTGLIAIGLLNRSSGRA